MQKMTKIVSLLLCFVMFVSLFAVTASAADICTVIFDCKNGSKITLTGSAADIVTPPADPSKDGATFKSWESSDGSEYRGGTFGELNGATVYAVYDISAFNVTFDKGEIIRTEDPRSYSWDPQNTEDQLNRRIHHGGTDYRVYSWPFTRWKAQCAGKGVDGSYAIWMGDMPQTWGVAGSYPINDGYDFFTVIPGQNYKFEMDLKISTQLVMGNGIKLVLSSYYDELNGWSNDASAFKNKVCDLALPGKDAAEYQIINVYGGMDTVTPSDEFRHIEYIFTTPALADPDGTHRLNDILMIYAQITQGDDIIIDNIKITKTDDDPPEYGDGNIYFYSGSEVYYTLYKGEYTVDEPFPSIPLPEAPEGKYLKGFSTDPEGKNIFTGTVVPSDAYEYYAVFADYKDTIVDDFKYNSNILPCPLNDADGHFYPATMRYGWSWRAYDTTTGAARYYAYSTWAVGGITVAADPEGGIAALRPYSNYTMTVKLKIPKFLENGAYYMLGYGLAPKYDPTDKNRFQFMTDITYFQSGTEGDDTIDLVYAFETGSMEGMLPVAGIFIGTMPGSEADIVSITLERAAKEYVMCGLELDGGFLDYDMTQSPDMLRFEKGKQTKLPEKAYRYRYAFDGWYTDNDRSIAAGEYLEEGKDYFAKWNLYGDVNGDGKVDNVDLIRAKKYFAGQDVEITAGTEVTGEGELSNTDLIRLKKYLAGMSVVLGPTRYLCLTFDDGPCENVADLLDSFKKVNGHATFMVIGSKCSDSTKPYLERIIEEGSEIGNHSLNHGSLTAFGTDKAKMKAAFTDCNKKVSDLLGGYEMKVGRLPNFAYDDTVLEAMREIKMPLMGNGITSNELTAGMTSEQLFKNVTTSVKDGDIVCLHATMDITAAAMDDILAELRADGYEFVTCSEMFEIKGYKSIPLGKNINRAEQQTKLIAFSFDDGPNGNIYAMTDLFKEYGGKCSYTLIGSGITSDNFAGLRYALANGFELANHSFTHETMTSKTPADALADFQKTDDALLKNFGITSKWSRLPGNAGNAALYTAAAEAGRSFISGSIFTVDYSGTTTTAEDVANSILKAASDGGISDSHLTAKTVEAMRIVLPELAAQGYRFVTVSELFEMNNYASIPVGAPVAKAVWQYE